MFFKQPLFLAAPVALGLCFAFIVRFLTLSDTDLDLGHAAMVEVQDQWHEGHPLPLGRVPEIGELLLRHQKLAFPPIVMAEHGLIVRGDVTVHEPELAIFDGGIAFSDIGLSGAERLDFRAHELNAAFEIVLDRIIEAGAAVFGDHLVVFVVGLLGHDRAEIGVRAGRVQRVDDRIGRVKIDLMLTQILLGSALTLVTIMVAAASWWGLQALLSRLHRWAEWPPHGLKLMVILSLALVWTLGMMSVAVWIWAFALFWLDIFVAFEASIYFALVAFTTLGFGDILLPTEWRLLGGICAANGLLMIGLLTAILVETLRETRLRQQSRRD